MNLPKKTFSALAGSLLALPGILGAPLEARAQTPANVQPSGAERRPLPDLMMLHGRLAIKEPGHPLHLGEESELVLSLKGPPLIHLFVEQSDASTKGPSPAFEDGGGDVLVQHHADGSPFVNVVPQRPGKIGFRLSAFFSDGGIEFESVTVPVVAVKPPLKLEVTSDVISHSTVTMDLSERWREARLWITADYPGLKRPLTILPKEARFLVKMAKGAPPIRFDPVEGKIDALRLGPALIETTYRGLTVVTCVMVTEDSGVGAYRSNCDALKRGGEPRDEIVDADLTRDHSELPYKAKDGRRGRFVADERLELMTPTRTLHLAQDNAIRFMVHGPPVAWIDCTIDGINPCTAWKAERPLEMMAWAPQPDGGISVNVFPKALGRETYTFLVAFVDGGVALKKISVDVDLGTAKPRAIARWCGNTSPENDMPVNMVAPLNGQESFAGTEMIVPTACYDGVYQSVALPANLVRYSVKNEGAEPAIQLDPATGKATALRPGQALVEQTFDGLTYATCVVVDPPGNPFSKDVSNCRELRAKFASALPEPASPRNLPTIVGAGTAEAREEMEQDQALTQATLSPQVRDRFEADARLIIPTDGVSAVLGEVSRLPVHLEGPAVLHLSIYQQRVRYRGGHPPATYEDAAEEEEPHAETLETDASGSTYVNVLALEPDAAQFRVMVLFADGGVATRSVRVPVKLAENESPHLMNALEDDPHEPVMPATILHLLPTPQSARWMYPLVYFRENGPKVSLGPQQVMFSVEGESAHPVIQIDGSTGKITPLRVGHALVRTRYAGAEMVTCVVVMADPVQGDKSSCEELRNQNPGMGSP